MVPDWIEALKRECERTSQTRTARRLGVAQSAISQLLRGTYPAKHARKLEARVRTQLMGETVKCPIVGEISKQRCVAEQARPFAATNPQRVALYFACREGCPHADGGTP